MLTPTTYAGLHVLLHGLTSCCSRWRAYQNLSAARSRQVLKSHITVGESHELESGIPNIFKSKFSIAGHGTALPFSWVSGLTMVAKTRGRRCHACACWELRTPRAPSPAVPIEPMTRQPGWANIGGEQFSCRPVASRRLASSSASNPRPERTSSRRARQGIEKTLRTQRDAPDLE
ncbi:hypothetical protein CCHR01_00267 [Colletotrichum chrysophilum]|uniref:Uncharacterized protein n=1 Tax=Colletotrichum chrysophilum TaxID=1836956 RepID=A0AAD9EQW9_9PEZI|nr:hypothetical protein CCHR01_00267 [Colletotrichum chrysophilum]